jgi:hypothetical protein
MPQLHFTYLILVLAFGIPLGVVVVLLIRLASWLMRRTGRSNADRP